MSECPPKVEEFANNCVEVVKRALEFELDFSYETLPILDHYLSQAIESKDEVVELLVPMTGAYFGEVVRRHFGARWFAPDDEYNQWRLEFDGYFLFFNPLGIAYEAVEQTSVDGWHSHLSMRASEQTLIESALDHVGDVRESDYYRLSLRFETIELVAAKLAALALQKKNDDDEPEIIDTTPDAYQHAADRESATLH